MAGRFDRYVPVLRGDADDARSEQELARLLNELLSNPLFRARVMVDVVLANGANRVAHALERKPQFVIGIAYTAGVVVTDDKNTIDHTDRLVSVRASGATSATLIVG